MSKKYRGKDCTYCGRPKASAGSDHVIAREFFLRADRASLPQVPSCARCNREKSVLEHYLTVLLPFGGRHRTAYQNLASQVPARLGKNARLHRGLQGGQGRVWAEHGEGLAVPMMTLPIDPQRLLDLFAMIARGLVWYHWQVRLTIDDSVVPCALTPAGEERFDRLFSLNVAAHVERDLGNGTFQYEGAQDVDEHRVTIWRFRPYGGVWFGDPSAPGVVARRIGVLTGPGRRSAVDRSERCDEGPAAFDAPTGQEASPSKLQAGSIG